MASSPAPQFARFWTFRFQALALCLLLTAFLLYARKATTQPSGELPPKPPQPRAQFVPGEVLVRFRSEAAAEEESKRGGRLQLEDREVPISVERFDAADVLEGLRLVRVKSEDTSGTINALNARVDVLYAEPNYVRYPLATPNDPLYPNLWGLHNTGSIFGNAGYPPGLDIHAEQAWNITTGSRSIVVGVVDGGIDVNHPDLHDNIWTNPNEVPGNGLDDDGNGYVDDINGFDFFHNQGNVFDPGNYDVEAHATHVAGTIGAVGNNGIGVVGVNWQVSLMSLKIFGRPGESPYPSSVRLLVRAYAYAKKMRDLWISSGGTKGANIRVLNNSIGGYGRSQTELDAVKALNDSGVLFVSAAGNYTRNNDVFPIYPAGYESPNVISVAASSLFDTLTSFTNVGARTVTLSAPGQTIQSTTPNGTYSTYNGTSMASPYVAGAAALICAAYPNISVDRLKAALIYNGDSIPSQQYKTLTGRRLNVFNALNAVAENDTTPPAAISDFRIVSQNGRAITLGWTAPGDDGNVGTASLYDIRYSDNNLSSPAQFAAATPISPLAIPIPSIAGTREIATVEVPFRHTNGFIGLMATDNMGNTNAVAVVPVSVDGTFASLYDVTESAPQALSTGGTALQLFGPGFPDDGYSFDNPLPFAFPFYGHWLRNVTVSLNGGLYFSTPPKFLLPPLTGSGEPLDAFSSVRALQTNMMIAGMWDDFIVTGVYAVTPDPNRVIFRWEGTTFDTPFDDGTSRGKLPISFEIELRKDGTIQVRYGDGNQKLFPVVGISGGGPDAYVVGSHTSENAFMNLTNANTVTFSPHFSPAPTSADLQVLVTGQSVVGAVPSGGSTYTALPAAVVPGQLLQYNVQVTDLGPDAADSVVLTSQLPAGTSFVGCSNGVTCPGPSAGTDGGIVTVNLGTLGQIYNNRVSGAGIQVRVNAPIGTTLVNTFAASSSTRDLNPANNIVAATTLVADLNDFGDVIAVDGSRLHTIALRQDGTVWFWGIPFGAPESADNALTTPRHVDGLSNITAIAAGGNHALALGSDGTVWSWGLNDSGQLGNQPISGPFTAFPPGQIPGLSNIQSVAANSSTSFAVAADGTVWAWGDNSYGQLGDGTKISRSVPLHLTAISAVRSISTNGNCTYAAKQDGTIWSWGSNIFGLLGNGTASSESLSPVQVSGLSNMRSVKTRYIHTVAVQNDGAVWAWGSGSSGQLGNGTTNDSNVPVRVSNLTDVVVVGAGDVTCLALKADGTVWNWGGSQSQLTPSQVAGLAGVKTIGAWSSINAAVMADNTLQMWGFNSYGGLGDSTLIGRNTPAAVKWLMVVATPTFDPDGNSYLFARDVVIKCETDGAVIHYTTNGADPTESDPTINSGSIIRIDHSVAIKAKAWKSGWTASNVSSATYTIGAALTSTPLLIQLGTSTYSVTKGDPNNPRVNITVNRSGDTSGAAAVGYATIDDAGLQNCNVFNGIASPRCDYETTVGTLQFAAGETSKSFSVAIVADSYAKGTLTFRVTLSNPSGATLGSPSTANVTIFDNPAVDGPNNPIDNTNFFVRQQYLDFLGREPDPIGGPAWISIINGCVQGDTSCDRIHVSQNFFQSEEFQTRGYFIYRFYPVSFPNVSGSDPPGYGHKPDYAQFTPDLARVSGFLDANQLEAAKVAFIADFMSRPAFVNRFGDRSNQEYVDMLLSAAGVTLASRQSMIDGLNNSTLTRAQVLRQIAESNEVYNKYYNPAFAIMEYFGYLRRDPDAAYLTWIQVLNQSNDSRGMITGFVNSNEYKHRFGP